MMHRKARIGWVAFAALLCRGFLPSESEAENWPQWRGPAGNSVSAETGLPTRWSETEHLAWKTPLPEWGRSTPAVWDDVLFLTTEADGRLLAMCIAKSDGQVLWTREVGRGTANREGADGEKRSAKFHRLHNMASPSPVTDGQRVIFHFGNGELASYRFDGSLQWERNLADDYGPYTIWWGHANSPVLYGDLVLSVCMQDSMEGQSKELAPSYLVAHDKRNGEFAWKTMRMTGASQEECDAYTTPVLVTGGDPAALIVMGGNQLDAYHPRTGERLWYLPGLVGGRTITGPTVFGNRVYATIGMRGPLHAVTISGLGERDSESAVVWKAEGSTPDTCCPVVYEGLVFVVSDNAVASCFDASTGALQWRNRLAGGGDFKSSPLAAGGVVYFLSRDGLCSVVRASREFELIAENRLDDEFLASPAVSDGRIYLRGQKSLYAVGD